MFERYAKEHGIEVGGYDLISDTRSGTGYDATNPVTGASEGDACMASSWKDELTRRIMTFVNQTGMSMIETDGQSIKFTLFFWHRESAREH